MRSTNTMFWIAAAVAAGVALPAACKKKEQEVAYPPPQPTPVQDAAPPPPPPTNTSPLPGDGGPVALDTITQQTLFEVIKLKAKKDAKLMKPLGEPFGASLSEGGRLEQQIMIDPKKCIGVIAVGGAGIEEVDIEIQARAPLPGLPGATVSVDNSTGREAAISPCWNNAFPVGFPASVVVKATRGTGAILAQVYVK